MGCTILEDDRVRCVELGRDLTVREGYAVVALACIPIGAAGAVPFLLTGLLTPPTAAFFESVPAFTTTGATVFGDIGSLPAGVLFWPSLTEWIGGMGIVVLGVAVVPSPGVGVMQLFQAEVPGPTAERLQPRIARAAKLLWVVYGGLTLAQVVLYPGLFAAGVLVPASPGCDLATAAGAAAATAGNIGPGIGDVGPVEHYGWTGAASQGVLVFLMLVGRLEIFTVLLLFHPDTWRHGPSSRRP